MKTKLNIGILFGGRSCEHEVSVVSARSMLAAVDREKYNVQLIGIDKDGYWHLGQDFEQLVHEKQVATIAQQSIVNGASGTVTLDLNHQGNLAAQRSEAADLPGLDVIFPVLHGTFGEDGTIQGVFEMAGIPYVGCGVAASAIAMDKALAKQVFTAAGIPQSPCLITTQFDWNRDNNEILSACEASLGYPAFVKPANMGSSVGVSKAHDRAELVKAIQLALSFDNKIIVERSMENCHEVECSILGNEDPIASVVGEILPGDEFYSYETKYIDDKSETLIPAKITQESAEEVKRLAIAAFKAIDGRGLSRVDFFVNRDDGSVYLNEINTLPGFTPISMYPKMWAASGIEYPQLIDKLIKLALDCHQSKSRLKRSF